MELRIGLDYVVDHPEYTRTLATGELGPRGPRTVALAREVQVRRLGEGKGAACCRTLAQDSDVAKRHRSVVPPVKTRCARIPLSYVFIYLFFLNRVTCRARDLWGVGQLYERA